MVTQDRNMIQAENSYLSGDYHTAKELYRTILKDADSSSSFIYQRLAQCHYGLKEYDHALAICRRAIELAPDSADAHAVISKIYYQRGDMNKAEKEARKAIRLDDTVAGAYVVLAGVEIARNDLSAAVKYAQKATQLDPDAWDTHFFLGIALSSGIDHREAIKELKIANKLNPSKELRFAVCYQYISANRTWISILLVILMLGALITGDLTVTALVSIVYFIFGILNLAWRKRKAAILSICIGFVTLGLYFLFW